MSIPQATLKPFVDFLILNDLKDFTKQGGAIYLYQSKDDEVVPFSNLVLYQEKLQNAQVRVFEDRGHFDQEKIPELIEDIKALA